MERVVVGHHSVVVQVKLLLTVDPRCEPATRIQSEEGGKGQIGKLRCSALVLKGGGM